VTRKSIAEMTYLVSSGSLDVTSINELVELTGPNVASLLGIYVVMPCPLGFLSNLCDLVYQSLPKAAGVRLLVCQLTCLSNSDQSDSALL